MTERPELPTTPAEAYDLLHSLFGIGTYDDVASREPWWKARTTEIAKVKALLKKRRTTPEQLGKAAWYAHHRAMPIGHTVRLFALIPEATRAWAEAEAAERRERTLTDVGDAIERALDAGDTDLAERLLRADPANVTRLLDEAQNRETR